MRHKICFGVHFQDKILGVTQLNKRNPKIRGRATARPLIFGIFSRTA